MKICGIWDQQEAGICTSLAQSAECGMEGRFIDRRTRNKTARIKQQVVRQRSITGRGQFYLRTAANHRDLAVASAQQRDNFRKPGMSERLFFQKDEKDPGRGDLAGNFPGNIHGNRVGPAMQIPGQPQRSIKEIE
ncbi:hypothetical protein JCM30471_09190 [Desulfuromonas carbonis]